MTHMPDQLSQTFSALADPTRRAMLARLTKGEASVSEIAAPFLDRMTLPAVTKHLQVLERAGLVTKTQDAQRRVCGLHAAGFKDATEYLEQYRQRFEESLDRFGAYIESVTAKKQPSKKKKSNGRQK